MGTKTIRRASIAVIAAALAVALTGCGASTPTIYPHDVTDKSDAEMYAVLNDTIDATGGLTAWRMWASNDPLDAPVTRGMASGDCVPTDPLGLQGDTMGEYDGALLNSTNARPPKEVVPAGVKVWEAAGYDVATKYANDITYVRASRGGEHPTFSLSYSGRNTDKPMQFELRAQSICQSYEDE